ncbi:RING-CH-type domain-containing protein [Heracleum sosnowskyi]|uniref:RING-CH-type domain-containing protein n=1 Tax=Heracleum sosnowskyi TaxID=360622 RepID=A0AAD8J3V4_9APIA|nr:RING-CH-type domain-containing protein [Heracleum sosnowskyi]
MSPATLKDSGSLHSQKTWSSGSDEVSLEIDGSFRLCLQVEKMDLESGEVKIAVQNADNERMNDVETPEERACRICHMSLMESCFGVAIELKCDCKGDLAVAHQHCADTWFKIRGNRSCEICGTIAHYVSKEENGKGQVNNSRGAVAEATMAPEIQYETPRNNCGRRIMNILLTCMILGFIISWLFHFHVLP